MDYEACRIIRGLQSKNDYSGVGERTLYIRGPIGSARTRRSQGIGGISRMLTVDADRWLTRPKAIL